MTHSIGGCSTSGIDSYNRATWIYSYFCALAYACGSATRNKWYSTPLLVAVPRAEGNSRHAADRHAGASVEVTRRDRGRNINRRGLRHRLQLYERRSRVGLSSLGQFGGSKTAFGVVNRRVSRFRQFWPEKWTVYRRSVIIPTSGRILWGILCRFGSLVLNAANLCRHREKPPASAESANIAV